MKKVSALFILLLVMSVGVAYGAGTSLVGKKVQKEMDISVNGKMVGKIIVVDGKGYAPVRDIANTLEMSVEAGSKGSVNLLSITDESETQIRVLRSQKEDLSKKIDEAESFISSMESDRIPKDEAGIEMTKNEEIKAKLRETIDKNKAEVIQKKAALPELKAMLDDINQQLDTLNAQAATSPQ